MRGTLSYVGRSASNLERARNINQLQPGTIQATPASTPTRCVRIWASARITLYETTGTSQIQQPPDAGRAAVDARRRLQRRLHVLADDGQRRRPQRPPAERLSTTAGTTASRISIARTCWCRRSAIGSRRSSRQWRRCAGCSATGTSRASSRRSRARRSTSAHRRCRHRRRRAGQRQPVLRAGRRSRRPCRTDWDPQRCRGAIWFDRNAFRVPAAGTFATTQDKNSLRQPGFWDINMSFRKGFNVVGSSQRFDLRMEAFNILNRTRLGNAVTNPTLPRLRLHRVEGGQPDDADRHAVHLLAPAQISINTSAPRSPDIPRLT